MRDVCSALVNGVFELRKRWCRSVTRLAHFRNDPVIRELHRQFEFEETPRLRGRKAMLTPTENRTTFATWVLVIVATLTMYGSCNTDAHDTN